MEREGEQGDSRAGHEEVLENGGISAEERGIGRRLANDQVPASKRESGAESQKASHDDPQVRHHPPSIEIGGSTRCGNFDRWSNAGAWARVLEQVQAITHQVGEVDWVASIDSTIVRVHQHGSTLSMDTGGAVELQEARR